MRVELLRIAGAALLLACAAAPPACAQNPNTMMPEASAAKAHELIQQMIEALGGPAYLQVRESVCSGRMSQFDSSGAANDPYQFKDSWRYPDKNRTEYYYRGNIGYLALLVTGEAPRKGSRFTQVYTEGGGWTLDLGGVSDLPAEALANFKEQTKQNINNLLRLRLKEKGMVFRYGGMGVVDLHEADWVEIEDADRRTFRLAISKSTHLPLRSVVRTLDETDQTVVEQETIFADFHALEGIEHPMKIERLKNGRRVYQAFLQSCTFNPHLADELFTRTSLEQMAGKSGKKSKDAGQSKEN